MITITVQGEPAPQGSKSFKGFAKRGLTKRGKPIPILAESNDRLKPWRDTVSLEALSVMTAKYLRTIPGAISLRIIFTMVKKGKRPYPDTKPDIDKLQRAVFDALTIAGVYEDDSRVVEVYALKVFPGSHPEALPFPGAIIQLGQYLPK